jgi:hypothetical protein
MTLPAGYSQEDWDLLTEEEQEALEEEEETEGDEEKDADLDEDAEGADDADNAEESGEGDEVEGHSDDADEEEGEEEAGEDGDENSDNDDDKAVGEDEDADKATTKPDDYQPLLRADLPPDIEEKLEGISTKREELDTQFDDGELTTKEYRQAMSDLDKQERGIEQQQFKAQIANEMREEQERSEWLGTVRSFLDQNPQYEEKPRLYNNLDDAVKEIAADEANQTLSGDQILAKAHEKVYSELGLTPPEKEKAREKEKADGKARRKASSKRKAPPTLGDVPASDTTDPTNTGKFSRLDRLMDADPEKYETELSKLSEAEQERYLAQ